MQSATTTYHVEDVGRILLQVQAELQRLRQQVQELPAAGDRAARRQTQQELMGQLDQLLRGAETDLRSKAEVVLNAVLHNSVKTLPAVAPAAAAATSAGDTRAAHGPQLASTWTAGHSAPAARSAPPRRQPAQRRRSLVREQLEQARTANVLANPASEAARALLRERYGIPFQASHELDSQHERVERARERKSRAQHRIKPMRQVHPGRSALGEQRRDPGMDPPPLYEEDVRQGMLALVSRGLIPPDADLTPAFAHGGAVLAHRRAVMHDWQEQFARPPVHLETQGFNPHAIKLDVHPPERPELPPVARAAAVRTGHAVPARAPAAAGDAGAGEPQLRTSTLTLDLPEPEVRKPSSPPPSAGAGSATGSATGGAEDGEDAELRASVERIRGYNELLDRFSLHQIIIRKGRVLRNTPEYQSFKRKYSAQWGPIKRILNLLEDLFSRYTVPLVYVDGQRVAALARDELARPSVAQLMKCVANAEELAAVLRLPGRRFTGPGGRKVAAELIQATYRMHVQRARYMQHKRRALAARCIQGFVRMCFSRKECQRRIQEARKQQEEQWRALQQALRTRWPELRQKRRVAIHVPSLSWDEAVRASTPNMPLQQCTQLARLCALADPLVDVLLVAPFPLPDDVLAYYVKLLEVGGVTEPRLRFKVVVPENADRFSPHFSLSSLALLSPRCLRRMRTFIRGREAYLVPGEVGHEDRRLALALGVPLLGPDPDIAQLFRSKSGSKRAFALADVNIPPGAHDLYEEEEVLIALSKLVAAHPHVERWLLKVDDETGGRGLAYLDTRHLPCVEALKKDRERTTSHDPLNWERPEVQEAARARVLSDLRRVIRSRLVMASPSLFRSYPAYMAALARRGGVVEAVPPDIRGSPSANIFIDPTGHVSLISTHDQLFAAPYCFSGACFPQQSVPAQAILGASMAVGQALYDKGIMGYVGIDFVAFWDRAFGTLRLWAVDLNCRLTPTASSFALFNFLMGGRFDAATNEYLVMPAHSASELRGGAEPEAGAAVAAAADTARTTSTQRLLSTSRPTSRSGTVDAPLRPGGLEPRHYVMHSFLYHPGLAALQYGAFFNMCRLQGVSFDLRLRRGTAFVLMDSLASGALGMLSVGSTRVEALKLSRTALKFLETQLGSKPLPDEFDDGPSNFSRVFTTVKSLLRALEPGGRGADVTK